MRRILVVFILAALLTSIPAAAHAKGATEATISGGGPRGLPNGPVTLTVGPDLDRLATQAGMWALLFEDGPGANLQSAPTARRGPHYTISWAFPDSDGDYEVVRQSVWPYAVGGPVTHMASGQPVFGVKTNGGWFRATDDLRVLLIALGLPDRPPPTSVPVAASPVHAVADASSEAEPLPDAWPWAVVGAGLLLAVALAMLFVRSRSTPAIAR